MSDVTQVLLRMEAGDARASAELLPLVYGELRKMAAARMARESPDHTLQATALVHEAYVRLVDNERAELWNSRGHFFGAAAEAMRRILVEDARRKKRAKHGGELVRAGADVEKMVSSDAADPLLVLSVHESLERLANRSPRKAELVKLRFFAGLTLAEAAEILGISHATAEDDWTYVRAWMRREWHREQALENNRES